MTDRWWSERNISQRSTRGATNIGRDQLHYTDQRNNPVINNNHRISFNSIQDAVEFAEQRAAPLHAEIDELHERLQAADDYADDLEGQLQAEQGAKRRDRAQLAAAVVTAFVLGCALMYALPGRDGPSQSAQASNPTTPAATVTATVTALPAPPPDTFTTMPCAPGAWVAFLATEKGEYASFLIAQKLAAETARAKRVEGAADLVFHASTWSQACSDARGYAPFHETRTFLWTGPFESGSAAQSACRRLGKPSVEDCLPAAAASA